MKFFHHADVLKGGVWQLLQDVSDPELKKLADALPTTVLHGQATSSTKKYLGAFRRWKTWASQHALPVFPAQGHHIASICSICRTVIGIKTQLAEESVNALGWIHGLAGVEPPAAMPISSINIGEHTKDVSPTNP